MRFRVRPGSGGERLVGQDILHFDNVADALNQACSYLAMGKTFARIESQDGKYIDGKDLEACCRGERVLNDDLRSH
jgi:hypothetical protein